MHDSPRRWQYAHMPVPFLNSQRVFRRLHSQQLNVPLRTWRRLTDVRDEDGGMNGVASALKPEVC